MNDITDGDVVEESRDDSGVVTRTVKTDTGFRLSVEQTRGSGTRNEDTVKMSAKTRTYDEVAELRPALVAQTTETMNELRANQPDD
jgi:hypothetical protein